MGCTDWSWRFLGGQRCCVHTPFVCCAHHDVHSLMIMVTWRLRHLEGTASTLNRADWTHLCDPRCPSLSSCVCDYTFYWNYPSDLNPNVLQLGFSTSQISSRSLRHVMIRMAVREHGSISAVDTSCQNRLRILWLTIGGGRAFKRRLTNKICFSRCVLSQTWLSSVQYTDNWHDSGEAFIGQLTFTL